MNQTHHNLAPFSDGPEGRMIRSSNPARPALRAVAERRHGFTLVEVLVAVGIIVVLTALAIPAILLAKRTGTETRMRSDMQLIGTALEAYKGDFDGQYPAFADIASDQASVNSNVAGNGTWLDYYSYGRGAVLLCRALIGPGPAGTNKDYANPGDDGADGPGFRVRRNVTSGANSTLIYSGRVYPAYIAPEKFKIQYYTQTGALSTTPTVNAPTPYPVILDIIGNPILYYPATIGNATTTLGYTDASQASSTTLNSASRFNGYDNESFIDATNPFVLGQPKQPAGTSFSNTSEFAQLAANCGNANYLLWSAGIDGQFGLLKGKSDDLTYPFDLPANLKK